MLKNITFKNITDEDIKCINEAEYKIYRGAVMNKFNIQSILTKDSPLFSKTHIYNLYDKEQPVGTFAFMVKHGKKREPKLIQLTLFHAKDNESLLIHMENKLKEIYQEFQINIPLKDFKINLNEIFKKNSYIQYGKYINELLLGGAAIEDLNKQGLFKENMFKNFILKDDFIPRNNP